MNNNLISRQAAIDLAKDLMIPGMDYLQHNQAIMNYEAELVRLPAVEPEWNNHTVACLLAELFDDTCACNYNDIDEWLPGKCELFGSCPNPAGVACWEQFLKYRAERRTDEDDDIS